MYSADLSSEPAPDGSIPYACKCLNICCIAVPPPTLKSQPTQLSPECTLIYVGEHGIRIAHPQLSLRHHSYTPSSQEANTQLRRTTISCLICQTAVYSISRLIPADIEGRDGPVLPTDDWVEDEVLKGPDGYVEVHTACLAGPAVNSRRSSSSFSSLFSVVVPPVAPTLTGQKTPDEPSSIEFLAHMKPIFPAPPFTPSHPIFVHLSSIAAAQSQSLRKRAEDELAEIVRAKIHEVDQAENGIRTQVNALWTAFRDAVDSVESNTPQGPRRSILPARRRSSASTATNGSAIAHSPRPSIAGFTPSTITVPQSYSSSSVPKVSTLSSSLATASFHHPGPRSSHPKSNASEATPGADFSVPFAGQNPRPSHIGTDNWETQDSSVLDCRRQTNETTDTATSYRYFMIEEEMRKRSEGAADGTSSPGPASPHLKTPSPKRKPSDTKNQEHLNGGQAKASTSTPHVSSPRSKKERRVTFEPDVVTIKRELETEKAEEAAKSTQHNAMMFDMEDDAEDAAPVKEERSSANVLPLIERAQPRRHRLSPSTEQGLPASYQAIRPSSLPAFSLPLPPATRFAPESVPSPQAIPRKVKKETSHNDEAIDEREAEILKLVAANTPSHRGAWKRDSKAWKSFVARHDSLTPRNRRLSRGDEDHDDSADSGFDDDDNMAYVGSLPIDIVPAAVRSRKEVLSLASYQPKSSLARQASSNNAQSLQRTPSATASRRAVYAERDRSRDMDPGAHDFSLAHEADEDLSDEDGSASVDDTERTAAHGGRKGRNYAKKILQARSTIPDDGMWRSLAT